MPGLLAPVRAGTRVEAVTSDLAWVQAMLDAEERVARVQRSHPVSLGEAAGTLAGYLEYAALAEGGTLADPDGYVTRLVDACAAETGRRRVPPAALRTAAVPL